MSAADTGGTWIHFGADGQVDANDEASAQAVRRLLSEAGLPPPGPGDQPIRLRVVRDDAGQVVTCGGYESYGEWALIRSVAVAAAERGRGRGRAVVEALLADLAAAGCSGVWLLTESAAPFFRSLGFQPVERADIPAPVHASRQLSGGCCSSAVALGRRDRARGSADVTLGEGPPSP